MGRARGLAGRWKDDGCSPYQIPGLVRLEARRSSPPRARARCCAQDMGRRLWEGGRRGQRLDGDAGSCAIGAGARHGAEAGAGVIPDHCHHRDTIDKAIVLMGCSGFHFSGRRRCLGHFSALGEGSGWAGGGRAGAQAGWWCSFAYGMEIRRGGGVGVVGLGAVKAGARAGSGCGRRR